MVRYDRQDTNFVFRNRRSNNRWLGEVALREGFSLGEIAVVFCSDDYLLDVNKRFLGHDYYTDIITFDYCGGRILSGDLLISVDSVRDNSVHFGTDFDEELHRVIVHGILHLAGYDDHSAEEQARMREKENEYLCLRSTMSL